MSKSFAIGEVLTAQDVNEFLANRIHRTILNGAEVVQETVGNISAAYAIVDEDAAGNKVVNLQVSISQHGGIPAGTGNTNIAVLTPALRPNNVLSVSVTAGTNGVTASLSQEGLINVRWAASSIPNGTVISCGNSYPILAT